jgi:hypothetical protein
MTLARTTIITLSSILVLLVLGLQTTTTTASRQEAAPSDSDTHTVTDDNGNDNDNGKSITSRTPKSKNNNKNLRLLTEEDRESMKEDWHRLEEERERELYEDNDYLNDLESWKHAWNYLHVVVTPKNPTVVPDNLSVDIPGQVLVDNAQVANIRGNTVGRAKQGCIRSTNFVCTWTVFLASITKSGCDVMLQGLSIPTSALTTFGVPTTQFVAIVGGTGPCRGITGEVKISPRTLALITEFDFEFYYIIRE